MKTEKRLIDANALMEELSSLTMTVTGLRAGKGVLGEFQKEYRNSVLRIVDESPTVDAVPAEKYNELEVRYKKMIETADILDTALRQYQRTYGE